MDVQIVYQTEQSLLSRKTLVARIAYEGVTPSRKAMEDALAKKAGAKSELVLIRKANPVAGVQEVSVEAYVYDTEKAKLTAPGHLAKRTKVPPPKEKTEGEGTEEAGDAGKEGDSE